MFGDRSGEVCGVLQPGSSPHHGRTRGATSPHRRSALKTLAVALLAASLAACGGGGGGQGAPEQPDTVTLPDTGAGGVPGFDGWSPDSPDTAADTGEPDAASPVDVAEPPVDTGEPPACAPLGAPCNDDDLCTFNDQCAEDGECRGTAISCDDGAPCTNDACVDGACTSGVASGFCLIEGVCWSEGQPNPANPGCEKCEPQKAIAQWSTSAGLSCNDGDACTSGDSCAPGTGCVGQPIQCDDGNPCTQDLCDSATGCAHLPTLGPCTTGLEGPCATSTCDKGECVTTTAADGAPCDDGEACTVSDICFQGNCAAGPLADADKDTFAAVSCGGTDCNDNAATVNPGAAEICGDGLDNDCDGDTDSADEECCPATACTYHTDCYPEQFCADWQNGCGLRCSDPCAGPLDCGPGLICAHLPGSAGFGYCRPSKYPDGAPSGSTCNAAKQCKSEICVGICGDYCGRESACPGANATCSPAGDLKGVFFGVCAPGIGIGTTPLGGACNGSPQCVSGHCDLLSGPSKLCSPLCKSDNDCTNAQECNIALPAGGAAPGTVGGKPPADSVPFDPLYTNKTFDTGLACFTRQFPQGTLQTGQPCTQPSQCRSNKCFSLDPANPSAMSCTSYCTRDSDCPANMQCKTEIVTIVSYWLANYGGANPNVGTLVRVCKF